MIVVTTPTGAIGQHVLRRLVAAGEPVRAIARDPDRLPHDLAGRIEIVVGSHGDPEVVDRAFAGADAVLWNIPPAPRVPDVMASYVDFTRPACAAFLRHGVRRVVGISAPGRGTPMEDSAGLVTASLRKDDLIAGAGIAYRALTMPSFMDNMLRQVDSIRDRGVFFSPLPGDLRVPHCATRDIGDMAVRPLRDASWSGVGAVPLLGPEDLSFGEVALVMSEVLGRPVHFEQVALPTYKAGFLQHGASEAFAQGVVDMMAAKIAGLDNAEPRTVEATTPTSYRQWFTEVLKPAVLAAP
jgi:uncharacterized protein YbjT (DUF2867 family)